MSEQEPTINVRKIGYTQTISTEAALYAGLITEEQARAMGWTPPPPVPWLRRKRWAVSHWWYEHTPRLHFGPCDQEDE